MALRRSSPMRLPLPIRRRLLSVSLAFFLTLVVYLFAYSDDGRLCYSCLSSWPSRSKHNQEPTTPILHSIPELDDLPQRPPGDYAKYCASHFSPTYLDDLRSHSIQYCTTDNDGVVPASQLTCFHGHIRDDNNADSFCIGTGASWVTSTRRFHLDCPVRRVPDANDTAKGLVPFDAIQPYWFDTGPKRVFEQFISLESSHRDSIHPSNSDYLEARDESASSSTAASSYVLLVKREGSGNLWHCLMEIWSMTMTLDVLRLAQRGNGQPFYRAPVDLDNTHVVILDNHGAGPTQDLWRLFSHNLIVTFDEMVENPVKIPAPLQSLEMAAQTNIIIPLPGGSNPLWHNDWIVHDCGPGDAPLLQLFIQRVFAHFDVPLLLGPKPLDEDSIVVTFINRRGTRQLLNNEQLLEALRQRYPHITVQSADFATLSLPDQLRLVQDTDVLVGVHGAGLTHTMFMRAGAGAVVEIQPEGLGYKGFRNLAAMTGHKYFSAEATMVLSDELESDKDGNDEKNASNESRKRRLRRNEPAKPWQLANVWIEEDRFLALMDVAIKSVYNEGLRNEFAM